MVEFLHQAAKPKMILHYRKKKLIDLELIENVKKRQTFKKIFGDQFFVLLAKFFAI